MAYRKTSALLRYFKDTWCSLRHGVNCRLHSHTLKPMPNSSPPSVRCYGIKNCDTMKKAMTWLTENGIAFEFVDYKKAGVAEANLPDWMARAGWETLLNRRGLMWKKLTDEERSAVDAKKAQKLMAQYPALIKRPVLDTGDALLVGFSPEAYAEHFA